MTVQPRVGILVRQAESRTTIVAGNLSGCQRGDENFCNTPTCKKFLRHFLPPINCHAAKLFLTGLKFRESNMETFTLQVHVVPKVSPQGWSPNAVCVVEFGIVRGREKRGKEEKTKHALLWMEGVSSPGPLHPSSKTRSYGYNEVREKGRDKGKCTLQ